jgi:iron complex outermembrane receptor protein
MQGHSTGIETWATFQAVPTWRLGAGLSALRQRLALRPGSSDMADVIAQQGRDPTHSWMLRSWLDLPRRTEVDAMLRRVGALSDPAVPAYTAFDLRVGWKPRSDLELSIAGRNLFAGAHAEFTDPATRTDFGPDVFFKAVWRL